VCDGGKHRRCIRGTYCYARVRGPPGTNKRKQERIEKKVAKAEAKAPQPQVDADKWVPIKGMWFAKATDGRGHYGGDGKYILPVPIQDFGAHCFLGGLARFNSIPGGKAMTFKLPDTVQVLGTALVFNLQVHPHAAGGRMIAVSNLEVKRAAA